jgi:hypothetical protein
MLDWVLIVGGSLFLLTSLIRLRRLPRILAYGNMLAGAGWVIVGAASLAPLTTVSAQIVNVGIFVVLVGLMLRLLARNSRQV